MFALLLAKPLHSKSNMHQSTYLVPVEVNEINDRTFFKIPFFATYLTTRSFAKIPSFLRVQNA